MIKNIDEIKANLDIVEIIQNYMPLRHSGANWMGKCPFHDENTPSFVVNKHKNIWHCFGCHEGGNGIDFIMKYGKLDFVSATKKACEICDLEIDETPRYVSKESLRLIDITDKFNTFFEKCRAALLAREDLLKYLAKRGFKPNIFSEFKIGYCIDKAEIIRIFGINTALELGLISDKGANFFENRILFFISDIRDNIIACAGRVHDYHNFSKMPKYINSKESAYYKKAEILYNLNNALKILRKSKGKILYIVEGYLDALTCNLMNLPAVALCGTAFSEHHLRLLSKYVNEDVRFHIALDNDGAGIQATIRLYKTMLKYGFFDARVSRIQGPFKDINDFYMKNMNSENIRIFFDEWDALPFCAGMEIHAAFTYRQKTSRLQYYLDYYAGLKEAHIRNYFAHHLKTFSKMIENDRDDAPPPGNPRSEEFIFLNMANDKEKRYLCEKVLGSNDFIQKETYIDIQRANPKAMIPYQLKPFENISNDEFYMKILEFKIDKIKRELQSARDNHRKAEVSMMLNDYRKKLKEHMIRMNIQKGPGF